MLSEKQVEFLEAEINKSDIRLQELKEDLLDHLCCSVEFDLQKGLTFEAAAQKAFQQVCPNGLEEIEKETVFLLNSKKIDLMKKLMYAVGLIASISMVIGLLLKVLHWSIGTNVFIAGVMLFVFLFLPMLIIITYRTSLRLSLSERAKNILGYMCAAVVGIGIAFKFLHYPGADLLLVLGAALFALGFLPFLFFKKYRGSF